MTMNQGISWQYDEFKQVGTDYSRCFTGEAAGKEVEQYQIR